MGRWYFSTRYVNPDSSPAATRNMIAASLAGSTAAAKREAPPSCSSGSAFGPAPSAGLSRTRVAISSGTPSSLEGCGACPDSGAAFTLPEGLEQGGSVPHPPSGAPRSDRAVIGDIPRLNPLLLEPF